MRRNPYSVELTADQCRLAVHALLSFRNKVIAHSIDPVDIDELITKLTHKPHWWQR